MPTSLDDVRDVIVDIVEPKHQKRSRRSLLVFVLVAIGLAAVAAYYMKQKRSEGALQENEVVDLAVADAPEPAARNA